MGYFLDTGIFFMGVGKECKCPVGPLPPLVLPPLLRMMLVLEVHDVRVSWNMAYLECETLKLLCFFSHSCKMCKYDSMEQKYMKRKEHNHKNG